MRRIDAACCYRRRAFRGLSVRLSVLDIPVNCAKTEEPIELPFAGKTYVSPNNHVLERGAQ